MLTRSVTLELLQSIAGRHAKVPELLGGVDEDELAEHRAVELSWEAPDRLAMKQAFRVTVRETLNHAELVTLHNHNVKASLWAFVRWRAKPTKRV
jgi:hypothetical protein